MRISRLLAGDEGERQYGKEPIRSQLPNPDNWLGIGPSGFRSVTPPSRVQLPILLHNPPDLLFYTRP